MLRSIHVEARVRNDVCRFDRRMCGASAVWGPKRSGVSGLALISSQKTEGWAHAGFYLLGREDGSRLRFRPGPPARVCQVRELFGWQFVFDGLCYVVDGGVLAELLELLIVGDALQPDLSGDLAVHPEYGGDLFFCQEQDLKHEVIAFFGAAAHARLTHEDNARQQDGFECYEGAEKGEGRWIEVVRVGGGSCVEDHPAGEDCQVDRDEAKTACEAGDGVAEAFGWSTTNEEVLFVFRDEVDVCFDVALGHAGNSF